MHQDNNKISILITNYNKIKYLRNCLNSCLDQNYKNFEIVIMDNFSNDGSQLILKQFEKKCTIIKKKRVHNEPAINQIDLIKNGVKFCKGKIICLLDSDDYLFSSKLKIINENFKRDKNLSVLFDIPIIKKKNLFYKMKLRNFYNKNTWPTIINTSCISIKKIFLENCIKNNLFDNYSLLEVDFRINAISKFLNFKYKIIKEDLTVYRTGTGGIMSRQKKYSKLWWIKRLQAHHFMRTNLEKYKRGYHSFFDYNLTRFINFCIIFFGKKSL